VGNLVAMKRTRELLQQELASHASDLEQLARQLVSRSHELQAALASARAARQHAEKATHAKSIFLGLVSHELRTRVATLKLDVRALEREVSGEVVGRLQRSIQRLGDLIESVQELTRLESGRLLTDVRAFDLPALAADLVDELRPHAQQKLLELRLRETASMPPLHSDPRLVRLVLLSLVLNAVKFTERGQVEVSLDYRNGRHRFTVSDTGPGVPAEVQARIFEPMQAAQSPLEKQPGVGLGLSLVREIVAALGGAVELRSAPGAGSTFTVSLPPADAGARSAAG
jgi:signal transduction histidine kinase